MELFPVVQGVIGGFCCRFSYAAAADNGRGRIFPGIIVGDDLRIDDIADGGQAEIDDLYGVFGAKGIKALIDFGKSSLDPVCIAGILALQRYADLIEDVLYAPKNPVRSLPATVRILDRTTETVRQASESVRQASETMSPKMRQAIDQAKTNMSDSLASVSEKIRRQQPEDGQPDADEPSVHDDGADAAMQDND